MYDTVTSSWGNGSVVVDAAGDAMSNEQIAAELNRLVAERDAFIEVCSAEMALIDAARRGDFMGNHTPYYDQILAYEQQIRTLLAKARGEERTDGVQAQRD